MTNADVKMWWAWGQSDWRCRGIQNTARGEGKPAPTPPEAGMPTAPERHNENCTFCYDLGKRSQRHKQNVHAVKTDKKEGPWSFKYKK